jgi:hypothetical protein
MMQLIIRDPFEAKILINDAILQTSQNCGAPIEEVRRLLLGTVFDYEIHEQPIVIFYYEYLRKIFEVRQQNSIE